MAALSGALIRHKRITTTLAKAKALRGWVEPILHRSKDDSTHSRRLAFRDLGSDKEAVKMLYDEIAGAVGDRPGGYPDQTGQRFLRALNIETGEIVWETPQPGPARAKTWTGVLATAGGLIFHGQPNGGFVAVDQRNGKTLWRFATNVRMKASPMTFTLGGNQYVAVAAGPNILCFGL